MKDEIPPCQTFDEEFTKLTYSPSNVDDADTVMVCGGSSMCMHIIILFTTRLMLLVFVAPYVIANSSDWSKRIHYIEA